MWKPSRTSFHVFPCIDGDAALANLADAARILVTVRTVQGNAVEGDGESRFGRAAGQEMQTAVGLFRTAQAGKLPGGLSRRNGTVGVNAGGKGEAAGKALFEQEAQRLGTVFRVGKGHTGQL